MKNRYFLCILIITALTFFTACEKKKTGRKQEVTLNNCTPSTNGAYICFDSLITDSRCPLKAECVWQGTAIIKVSFYETGSTHRFRMSLKGFPHLGYPSDTIINGRRIIFTDLTPYPEINDPIPEVSNKKASFVLSP